MTVSVVVPGRDCAETLTDCLAAIAASSPAPAELIFFDDGSDDGSGAIAAAAGARVLRNDGPALGPATGRNRAAAVAMGDVLAFVDADVVVQPDAIAKLSAALGESGVVAAFGSYDDRPPARNLASLYMNLRHHTVHQQGSASASTFWAGLGAVRTDAFRAVGGFAASYGQPSIEDIELGHRLIEVGGGIRLIHGAQGTHRKRWTVLQVWRTDILQRAIPWSRLIADGGSAATDLNAAADERRAAVLAHLAPAAWLASTATPWAVGPAALLSIAYLAQNRRLFAVFRRNAPRRHLPALVALHWAYHVYASQIFGWTLLTRRLFGRGRERPQRSR